MSTVLIVDDCELELSAFAAAFESHGIKAVTTKNPDDVLPYAIGFKPDFIILDLYMPEVSGLELCKQLKIDRRTRDIPIVFVTASDSIEDVIQSFHLGCIDYIHKPVKIDQLVREVLRHKVVQSVRDAYKPLRESLAKFTEKYGGDEEDG